MSQVNNSTLETPKDIEVKTSNGINYVVISILVWISGNPPFRKIIVDKEITLISILLLFSFLLFTSSKERKFNKNAYILLLFMIIGFIHMLEGGDFASELGHIIRIAVGCFAAMILGNSFRLCFINLMTWIASWSILLWLVQITNFTFIFTPLLRFLSNLYGLPEGYCLFYHFMFTNEYYRNSGIFWEPGAYACFLCVALFFLYSMRKDFPKKLYRYSFWLFSISILTTFSTTGYCAYFLVLLFYSGRFNNSLLLCLFLIVLMLLSSYYLYSYLPFLHEKIDIQIESTRNEVGLWQINRFGSFIFDLDYIKRRPLFGWGHNFEIIDYDVATFKDRMGNGFSGYIFKNGIIGLFIILYSISSNLKKLHIVLLPTFFVLVFCIMLQGEMLLEYPFFLSLVFLSFEPVENGTYPERSDSQILQDSNIAAHNLQTPLGALRQEEYGSASVQP